MLNGGDVVPETVAPLYRDVADGVAFVGALPGWRTGLDVPGVAHRVLEGLQLILGRSYIETCVSEDFIDFSPLPADPIDGRHLGAE